AASIQKVTENVMLKMVQHAHQVTGLKNLCLAGGVALNCVGNGRVLREGPFEDVWIQPAAGDAGGALGVISFVWHQLLGNARTPVAHDSQSGSLLGPEFSDDQVREFLDTQGAVYETHSEWDALYDRVAQLLASEKVVGWMQGRMEFGPRALGARSILGDARSREMQSVMNLKIKFRESFRPFAPSVLEQSVSDYFEMEPGQSSPYMLLVAPVQPAKRVDPSGDAEPARGLDKLKECRSVVPAITHVDYSARVQTVDAEHAPRFHGLLSRFHELTGSPMVINTSFNVRGEPIVCTPEDAYRCFMATNMDVLVMEHIVLLKENQPNAEEHESDRYLSQFNLD
ncbi:MAG: carbamoyltransferase C-terminal domain-containing protein, partial [Planctomycetota bacterium]|nr:carbamoyltransferase C-terminal domain-containing protein [Planctomycetota bacterium]